MRCFGAISELKPTLQLVQGSAPKLTNAFPLRSTRQAGPKLSNAVLKPTSRDRFKAVAFALPTGFATFVGREISLIIIPASSYVSIVFVIG